MISCRDVSKKYDGHVAVDHIHLDFKKGEKHVLIGTSGSGKTTLLKMINKLVSKSAGEILVDGKSTDDWDDVALRRSLGYVIQEVGLFPHYTVGQNIGVVPSILRWPESRVTERTLEVLAMVGLEERYISLFPDALSGGQQQRVGIARALAADPSTLLMDEPFGALDPITRSDLQREFISLPGIADKTVILVTHDMMEAALIGEVITVLDKGQVQQSGTLEELLFSPANDFVKDFLGNHRTQLELRAVKVQSLIPWLTAGESNPSAAKIDSDTSLDALPDNGMLEVNWQGNVYVCTREDCYSLYYQHRGVIIKKLTGHG